MTFKSKARRAGWLLVVATFAFGIISAVKPAPTEAYSLISSRSIRMSSSIAGATNTLYSVGFTTTSGASVGSMVIRFCSNNPIIGDTCTAPTGFNTNFSTLTTSNQTGITGWTLQTGAGSSNANELVFTKLSASAVTAGTSVTIDLGNGTTNGITNPTATNTTYYARIMLFASTSSTNPAVASDDVDPASGGSTDAGGVALSTATALNVTAKVQESLRFCVYTAVNCAGGGSAVNLGDSNGVLADTTLPYTNADPKFDLASNALNGVAVRLKGGTLTSGTFTITPSGASCVADSVLSSVEQFGVRVVTYGTGQYFGDAAAGSTTPTGTANDFSCLAGNHKFDPTTTNTTYGQSFVRTIGATDISTTNFELMAKAANTTEAGVYTTILQLIATATY